MSRFPYLLFDADNTLFDFNKANRAAFHQVCVTCDLPESEENYRLYESINGALWHAFDRGECTKEFLVVERFRRFLSALGLERDPEKCNEVHLTTLGRSQVLLPYAEEVCRELAKDHRLYLVTNAVASVQRSRLSASAIAPYITDAFISEEAGANKPTREYFDYVFARVPGLRRDNCLLIGDSLSSDIRGANNAGIPCVWYNPWGHVRAEDLRIDWEITDLRELYGIV
jgi:YjjG family noncanonical pyrimidine nucleotidase